MISGSRYRSRTGTGLIVGSAFRSTQPMWAYQNPRVASYGSLLELGIARGGQVPQSKAYVWRNLPLDVGHVLTYFVAHEAHHRGQMTVYLRLMGAKVPAIYGPSADDKEFR